MQRHHLFRLLCLFVGIIGIVILQISAQVSETVKTPSHSTAFTNSPPQKFECPSFEVTEYERLSFAELARLGGDFGVTSLFQVVDAELIGAITYRVPAEKQSIKLIHRVHYGGGMTRNGKNLPIRYILLIDEHQTPFQPSDPSSLYQDVVLKTGEEASYEIALPVLKPGTYNIILYGFYYYDEPPDFGTFSSGYHQRLTLVIGDGNPDIAIKPFQTLQPRGFLSRNDTPIHLLMGLDDTLHVWTYPTPSLLVKFGKPIAFNVKVGAHIKPLVKPLEGFEFGDSYFALLAFQDYKQVPVDKAHTALYIHTDADTAYAQLDINLQPLTEQGDHEIAMLRIENPGLPMCYLLDTTEELGDGDLTAMHRSLVTIE